MNDVTVSAIREGLRKVLKDRPGIAWEQIQLDTAFADLGLDSLDMVELLFATERHFGVEISDAEAREMRTVGDLVAYVSEKKCQEV